MVSDFTKDFYGDLGALFCEPMNEEVMLSHVDSIDTVKPSEHIIISKKITYWSDTNIRATTFSNLVGTETGAMKRFAIGIEDERFSKDDGLVVRHYV